MEIHWSKVANYVTKLHAVLQMMDTRWNSCAWCCRSRSRFYFCNSCTQLRASVDTRCNFQVTCNVAPCVWVFDDVGVLYGYNPEDSWARIFNYFIVLAKRHIFLSRKLEPKTLDLTLFFEFVKEKLLVQKAILYSENQRHFILCGSHFCHYFKWTGVT